MSAAPRALPKGDHPTELRPRNAKPHIGFSPKVACSGAPQGEKASWGSLIGWSSVVSRGGSLVDKLVIKRCSYSSQSCSQNHEEESSRASPSSWSSPALIRESHTSLDLSQLFSRAIPLVVRNRSCRSLKLFVIGMPLDASPPRFAQLFGFRPL